MENSMESSHSPVKEVIRLSWPIVVSMLSYTAMGVTDTLFVGWVGKVEVAAVGLAIIAIFLVNSFFLGVLNGVKIVSAQATGAKDHKTAVSAGWQGVILSIPFGLSVIALGCFREPIFDLIGGSDGVKAFAGEYFKIRVYSATFWYVTMALCNAMQGTGDTKTPMNVNLVANGLNIVLDPIFIFGLGPIPAMGVYGAGLATVLACFIGMAAAVYLYIKRHGVGLKIDLSIISPILKLGLPNGVRFALDVGGWTVFTALLARMGDSELAANHIAISIIKVSFMPGYAISEAACILTGNYLGAKSRQGIRSSFAAAMKVSIVYMAACGVVFWLAPELLLRCFQTDPEVIRIGRHLLWVAAFFQIIDAVALVAIGSLNGVGDTKFTMYISIIATWFVLLPSAYYLGVVLEMGALGAWLGLTGEIVLHAFVCSYRFLREGWSPDSALTSAESA